MADQVDNTDEQLATDEGTDEETIDDVGEESSGDEEEEQAASEFDALKGTPFKSVAELAKGYQEIQRFVGGRKELEEKARAYDQLVKEQVSSVGRPTAKLPRLQQYVQGDGSINVAEYDEAMEEYLTGASQRNSAESARVAREQTDLNRAENDFPYLKTDGDAAKLVMSAYRSGQASTLYEAAQMVNAFRSNTSEEVAKKKTQELGQKIKGTTQPAGGRSTFTGEMTEERFAKMSRENQKAYIEKMHNSGRWGDQ